MGEVMTHPAPIPVSMAVEQIPRRGRANSLVRGVAYLATSLAMGLCLMLTWPQGGVCTSSCTARIEAGAQTVAGLAATGAAGFVAALWLGLRRRSSAPRWLLVAVAFAIGAALVIVVAAAPGASDGDTSGLAAARAARAWIPALPAFALLVAEACAALGEGRRRRAATLACTALAAFGGLLVAASLSAG